MRTRLIRRLAATAAASAVVLGTAGTASAQDWHHTDASHDVSVISYAGSGTHVDPTSALGAPPEFLSGFKVKRDRTVGRIDITRVMIRNRRPNIVVQLWTRSPLPPSNLQSSFEVKTPTTTYFLSRMDAPGMQMSMTFSNRLHFVACPDMSIAVVPHLHSVRLTLPRYCVGRPDWIRVQAGLTHDRGKTAQVDDALGGAVTRSNLDAEHWSPRIHVD